VADGAGVDLVPCIAVAGSIIRRWVVASLPISGMGPCIRVAGRIVRAAGRGKTTAKFNSPWDSMAVLTVGQIVFCSRSVQSGGGVRDFMGRIYAGGMTARCNAICIGETSREAAGSTRQRTGAGTCGLVAESATGVLRSFGGIPVRGIVGGIRIVGCPFPVCRMRSGRRMTGRGGAVPGTVVQNVGISNKAAAKVVSWPAMAVSTIKLINLCCRAVIAGV
jgi:hypothetical protein